MYRNVLILAAGVVGVFLIVFSALKLGTVSQDLDTRFPSKISATIDQGSMMGPIELVFNPIVDVPEKTAPGVAFPIIIKMELADATDTMGYKIDPDHMDTIRTGLRDGLSLRLNFAGAEVVPSDWQNIGSDLTYQWSVRLPDTGLHEGNIEKRIVFNGNILGRSNDQISVAVKVGSLMSAWTEAWGHIAAILGLIMSIGSFYFGWRKHRREERRTS